MLQETAKNLSNVLNVVVKHTILYCIQILWIGLKQASKLKQSLKSMAGRRKALLKMMCLPNVHKSAVAIWVAKHAPKSALSQCFQVAKGRRQSGFTPSSMTKAIDLWWDQNYLMFSMWIVTVLPITSKLVLGLPKDREESTWVSSSISWWSSHLFSTYLNRVWRHPRWSLWDTHPSSCSSSSTSEGYCRTDPGNWPGRFNHDAAGKRS